MITTPFTESRQLRVSINFDSSGCLQQLHSDGPFVNTERHDRLIALVDTNATWDDDRVVKALLDDGARYAPTQIGEPQELFESRIRALGRFWGTTSIRELEFTIRDKNVLPGYPSQTLLFWRLEVDASAQGQRPNHYTILLEPWDGRIISIRARNLP